MRKIGEVKLGAIPPMHRPMEVHQSNKKNRKKNVLVKCRNEDCNYEWMTSVNKIRQFGDNTQCYSCFKKSEKEMQQALINLAKRKGLI